MRVVINAWRDLAHPQAGGSEQVVDVAARGLARRGHDVVLVAGGPVGARPYTTISSGGTYDHYLRTPLVHRRLPRPDVVLDVSSGMTYYSPIWCRRPVVLMVHHVHLEQWGTVFPAPVAAVGRVLEGRLAPHTYRRSPVLSPSPSTTTGLVALGYPAENIRSMPIPIRRMESDVPLSPTPKFVSVGRLVAHKRFDLLFQMWERVRPRVGGQLVLIGDGPERERLERIRPPGTSILGYLSEEAKSAEIASSWLLLHAASHEGWGIVITEAGQLRVASIGFAVPGVRDAIVDGETGVLADTPDSFVDAWIKLAGDADQRRDLGEQAHRRAARHLGSQTVDAVEGALHEAVESTPAG